MKKILEAAFFSASKHTHQRRKGIGDTPYINHPLEVVHLLSSVGEITDEDILSAALLHDTIEDTATKAEEIENVFGTVVLSYVLEVSDNKLLPKSDRKRLQVKHAGSLSTGAKLIKLGDRIANLRSVVTDPPKHWPVKRQIEYFEWSHEVFNAIRGTNEALEALFLKEYNEGLKTLLQRQTDEYSFRPRITAVLKKIQSSLLMLNRNAYF